MKRILVTGGAGYIGSICTEHLLDEGFEVAVFDNLSEGHRAAVDERAVFFEGDLLDRNAVRLAFREFKPEAVMHFAANALVAESMTNPSKYFRNNFSNGINLLDMMVEAGTGHIVFSSTCATFGVPEHMPLDESQPQAPINPYGESKLMFEKALRWYAEIHPLRFVALRYFNAAGASAKFGEHHRVETHLIPNVLKVALGQREHVEVYGTDYDTPDGTCIRDYIHVADLAEAHGLALDRLLEGGEGGAFNLGTGEGHSVLRVIDTARRITGHAIPTRPGPRRDGDPPRLIADPALARRELGWTPSRPSLETQIGDAWAWHRKGP